MIKLILFLFPLSAFANWTAVPDDGFTYATQEGCLEKHSECFELKDGIEKDTMKIIVVSYEECEWDADGNPFNCAMKNRNEIALDEVKKSAKDAAAQAEIAQQSAAEQARKDAATRLKAMIPKLDLPMNAEDIRATIKDILILQGVK